jgi:hypothetical protein
MAAKKPKRFILRHPKGLGPDELDTLSETERAIFDFLTGKFERKTEQEREARLALADMLHKRSLPRGLLYMLANRFDPTDGITEYQLVLEPRPRRQRGRPKVPGWEIAEIIERRLEAGDLMKQACGYAADVFEVSKRAAEKAYAENKEEIKQIREAGPGVKVITRLDR